MATVKRSKTSVHVVRRAARGQNKLGQALHLHGTIARDLGVLIVSGRYRPDDLLNGEIAASDRLRVSRTAYREAMRILAAKGLVESRPKVGTRVNAQEHDVTQLTHYGNSLAYPTTEIYR